jgi:small ligand-binding sensory domain FIST
MDAIQSRAHGVKIGAGVCSHPDPAEAGATAAGDVAAALGPVAVDLAVVFASGRHLATPEPMLDAIHTVLAPRELVGCGAGGVLGGGRELESGTGLAVWAAAFEGAGDVRAFHAELTEKDGDHVLSGLPALAGASGAIMLADPYSFPTDAALSVLAAHAPAVPLLGGIASARTPAGDAALFVGEEVFDRGAVGIAFEGIEMLPCVSQGAAPLGPEMTITAAEDNMIHELAGRPALDMIERTVADLTPRERVLIAGGMLIGIVIDSGKPEYEQGDFLVRGLLGADPDTGSVAVGASVSTGQVVRLHARDAASADEDLRRALQLRVAAMAGAPPAGALVFSCNGRGSGMFGLPDHDASVVEEELSGAPAAGFFAAGEIGPVSGRSFLHSFTATVAVFPR